jgi:hypothetical protein
MVTSAVHMVSQDAAAAAGKGHDDNGRRAGPVPGRGVVAGLADGQAGTESAGDMARVAELADGDGAGAGSPAAWCASAASRNSAMMLPRPGPGRAARPSVPGVAVGVGQAHAGIVTLAVALGSVAAVDPD